MAVEFYGLKLSAPCWSVMTLGHRLGLEFNFHEVNVLAGEQFDEEFLKVTLSTHRPLIAVQIIKFDKPNIFDPPLQMNPQHCIPTIVDGDCTLWESRAILQYFANKYDTAGTLYPIEPEARARVDQKLFFDMTFFNKAREFYFAKWFKIPPNDPERLKWLEQQMEVLDKALAEQQYVAGDDVTIADFSLMSTVTFCELGKFPLENYANVIKWMELCKESVPEIFADEECKDIVREKLVQVNQMGEEEEEEVTAAPEEQEEVTESTVEEVEE